MNGDTWNTGRDQSELMTVLLPEHLHETLVSSKT